MKNGIVIYNKNTGVMCQSDLWYWHGVLKHIKNNDDNWQIKDRINIKSSLFINYIGKYGVYEDKFIKTWLQDYEYHRIKR